MRLRGLVIAPLLVLGPVARAADSPLIVEHLAGLTITVDTSQARPGGLLVVKLHSPRPLGAVAATLNGWRAPFFSTSEGPRALLGIPVTIPAGPAQLGVELRGRRGRRRIAVGVVVAAERFASRATSLPADRSELLRASAAVRDSRRLLAALRSSSDTAYWNGPLRPPVDASARAAFGMAERSESGLPANQLLDALYGEYHRGLDYDVPTGTLVQAPAAGVVVLAAALTVAGQTVVIDHGHGLVSVLCHLSRIDVAEGQRIEGRTPIGLSGDTGAIATPQVHWGTYLSGIAVDPSAIMAVAF
jgi:murein DD-endopeptidase MepM/ murein hydrolase activator NlpD